MFCLKLLSWDEGHLYAKCLFNILAIYRKCHLFRFFIGGIRMHIPILTGAQNGRISGQKDSVFLLKNILCEVSLL